jgi:hypothetical protein
MLEALAACAAFVDEDVLFRYDASALSLEARLLLQLLCGRPIPSWVGAYRDRGDGVDLPLAAGAEISVVGADWKALEVVGERTAPDHFGQRVLERWHGTVPRGARVVVDGVARTDVARRWEDRPAQQWDRHRRRTVGWTNGTLPSRADEVRVWKPVPGPFGSFWPRARWRVLLWRRRFARIVKKLLGRD